MVKLLESERKKYGLGDIHPFAPGDQFEVFKKMKMHTAQAFCL